MFFAKRFALVITAGASTLALATLPALADQPYWDNSSSTPYYTPPASTGSTTSSQQSYGSSTTSQYGAQPYGQQQYSGAQGGYNAQPYGQPSGGYSQTPSYGGNSSYGQQSQYGGGGQALQGYVSSVPPGTNMSLTSTTALSSQTSHIGDPVSATLGYDVASGGQVVIPSGSQIQGEVVSAVPAGRAGRQGQLQLRFTRAILPDGRQIPLSARLVTQDGSGVIRGGTGRQRAGSVARNTLGGAAIGGASGTAIGALSSRGRGWNEGLMWGSILGAGAGLLKAGVNEGQEAMLQAGTPLQIMLDQPMAVPGGGYSNSTGAPNANTNYNNSYPQSQY